MTDRFTAVMAEADARIREDRQKYNQPDFEGQIVAIARLVQKFASDLAVLGVNVFDVGVDQLPPWNEWTPNTPSITVMTAAGDVTVSARNKQAEELYERRMR